MRQRFTKQCLDKLSLPFNLFFHFIYIGIYRFFDTLGHNRFNLSRILVLLRLQGNLVCASYWSLDTSRKLLLLMLFEVHVAQRQATSSYECLIMVINLSRGNVLDNTLLLILMCKSLGWPISFSSIVDVVISWSRRFLKVVQLLRYTLHL